MKIGIVRTITKEDLGADVPDWANRMLGPLNSFIQNVGAALQSRLDFENNFLSNVLELKFESGTELAVNPQSGRLSVLGVLPLYTGGSDLVGFKWRYRDDGKIGVTLTFTGGGTYTCRLLVLYR